MRKQDLLAIIVLAIVVALIGVLMVDSLTTPPSERYELSEEPQPIPEGYSQEGLEYMRSGDLFDFTVTVDGETADKNPTPFGE